MLAKIKQTQYEGSLVAIEIHQLKEDTILLDRQKEEKSQQWMYLSGRVNEDTRMKVRLEKWIAQLQCSIKKETRERDKLKNKQADQRKVMNGSQLRNSQVVRSILDLISNYEENLKAQCESNTKYLHKSYLSVFYRSISKRNTNLCTLKSWRSFLA